MYIYMCVCVTFGNISEPNYVATIKETPKQPNDLADLLETCFGLACSIILEPVGCNTLTAQAHNPVSGGWWRVSV